MRIRWRGLELPTRLERDKLVSTNKYGKFYIEPFERGFGTTIGNSLRRVLLSSLEGSAVTSIKIAGVDHEFTSIKGVMEDVTDIVLNVKSLVVRLTGEGPKTMTVSANKAGVVKSSDIAADSAIEVVDKEKVIVTLTEDVEFQMEGDLGYYAITSIPSASTLFTFILIMNPVLVEVCSGRCSTYFKCVARLTNGFDPRQ